MGEIEYQEVFVKDRVMNDAHSINYVLDQIKEVHSEENGWEVGEPEITVNPDGQTVTIKVELKKYKIYSHERSL